MTYYVIADIHGQKELLDLALEYVYSKNGDKVIFLGDYIDRGPDSLGVVNVLMNPPEGVEFITLMGNHEDMFINDLRFDSYYCEKFRIQCMNNPLTYEQKKWFANLKKFHIEGRNVFAHANYDAKHAPDEQVDVILMWYRFNLKERFESEHFHLTHGHTPFKNGPEMATNRTNLDCSAKDGNQICVGIYETGIKGPVKFCLIQKDGSRKEFLPNIK